jgi:hypothetical protein
VKAINADGFEISLANSQGHMKCNMAGPDLCVCPNLEVPQSVLASLPGDTCCTYRRGAGETVPVDVQVGAGMDTGGTHECSHWGAR